MLKFERPEPTELFEKSFGTPADNSVWIAKEKVRRAIERGDKPDFDDLWRRDSVKRRLSKAQNGKCGYCEIKCLAGDTGDIEHYAPKAEVHKFLQDQDGNPMLGREKTDLSNIQDRKSVRISDTGYWFKAYDWNNYLLSCNRCNTAWKGCLFPVEDAPRRLPPQEGRQERPLLLNPFDDDPIEHFDFNAFGQIDPRTDKGRATVDVCGLFRESLRDARQEKAKSVFSAINSWEITDQPSDLNRVLEMGNEEYAHAGMVRSIVYHTLGLSWKDFEAFLTP